MPDSPTLGFDDLVRRSRDIAHTRSGKKLTYTSSIRFTIEAPRPYYPTLYEHLMGVQ